jgi:hypothetical protein
VSNKSSYMVYTYIVKHNYILGGMLFTICKAQLQVSATNASHLQVVRTMKTYHSVIHACVGSLYGAGSGEG